MRDNWLLVGLVVILCLGLIAGAVVMGSPQDRAQAFAVEEMAKIAARNAAHERAMEIVPLVVMIVGGLLLALVVVLVAWDLRRTIAPLGNVAGPRQDDGMLLAYLQKLELAQMERDREMWRVLAQVSRVRISSGNGG